VYYDTNQVMNVTDVEAVPFAGGGVSIDLRTTSSFDTMNVDNLVVTSVPPGTAPLILENLTGEGVRFNPVIESVRLVEGEAIIRWTAMPGSTYRLQYTASLDQPDWQDATENILATDATVTATNSVGTDPQRFYRVVLLP
jgi:hypothetical protein